MTRATTPDLIRTFARIGLLSFGGPAGQIALMHRTLVDEKGWLDETRFLHALNFCMLLPGPEAQQLATYTGWLFGGIRGGLIAGLLFVLPGLLAMLCLSWIYVLYGNVPLVEGLFFGLKAAVLAIVVQALLKIAARALNSPQAYLLAVSAFLAIFAFGLPFPVIIAAAALIGILTFRGKTAAPSSAIQTKPFSWWPTLTALILWLLPIAVLLMTLGKDHTFTQIGIFFSQMAVVTFGGAYAVLAYVAQQAVDTYGWLAPGEMMDGLGLAETTPGPLIMVTQFVGFLGAYRESGSLMSATGGALLTTWVTFAPCFLWIFAFAPFIERLRGNIRLSRALEAITAAIVGVIANVALWFALQFLFADHATFATLTLPIPTSLNISAAALTGAALLATFGLRLGLFPVLAACAVLGLVSSAAGLV